MSAHLSRKHLFQRHLRSSVWVWVWVWDGIHSHASLRTRSPSSRHPPFTHYPFPPRSLVCGGQTSPHKPRLVVSNSTCPPLSSSPHAHSFVLGTAVINNNAGGTRAVWLRPWGRAGQNAQFAGTGQRADSVHLVEKLCSFYHLDHHRHTRERAGMRDRGGSAVGARYIVRGGTTRHKLY